MPGGPSERCRRHHGDDGTRFRGVCRDAAAGRASGLLVRQRAAARGHARPRRVATFAGLEVVQPRRGICRDGCGRSHVLLPAWLLSRRRYAATVIFAALALRAAGLKVTGVAARLRLPSPGRPGQWWPVPVSTASSWLSRFAGRAGRLRQAFLAVLPLADPQARPVAAAGSPSGDALAALDAVTAGLRPGLPGWTRWRRMRWPRT